MFNSQHWKIKLVYIGFGSLFGCLCTIIGMLASPATAQRDKFQEIECTKLTLIDPLTGKSTAVLWTGAHGGQLALNGGNENTGGVKLAVDRYGGGIIMFRNENDGDAHASATIQTTADGTGSFSIYQKNGGEVSLGATDHGGYVLIYGAKHNKKLASMGVTDDGESGLVSVKRYDRGTRIGLTEIAVDLEGGRFDVFGKDGQSVAGIRANDDGGRVYAYGKDGKSKAALGIHEYGGRVDLHGRGEGKVAIGINEYGNGAVSTWDKNGYRQ